VKLYLCVSVLLISLFCFSPQAEIQAQSNVITEPAVVIGSVTSDGVVFHRFISGNFNQIATLPSDFSLDADSNPAWFIPDTGLFSASPNGRFVAFPAVDDASNYALFIFDLVDANLEQISVPFFMYPSWAPDSAGIRLDPSFLHEYALDRGVIDPQRYFYDLTTSQIVQITQTLSDIPGFASWLPDSSGYFYAWGDLTLVDRDGTNKRRLGPDLANFTSTRVCSAIWLPNNARYYFRIDCSFAHSLGSIDTNGNFITTIGMENSAVRKSTYNWDDQNRMVDKKHYSTDGTFRYGYYYKYKDGAQLMYKIEDSLLFRKRTSIENENISTYSEYDKNGKIILKNVYVKDNDMKWLLETRFQNDKIYVQYHYEYLDDKKYVTKVQFDKNGTKVSEKRYLDEVKIKNGLEHYTEDDERLFRIDSFDINGNLIEMKLLDEDGNQTRIETYTYNSKGQLTKLVKENLSREQKIVYSYKYDKTDKIELVKKDFNGNSEIFRYEYKTFYK